MTHAARVELRLLGRFAALRDGVEIAPAAFAGRKVRTLVKVLATRQGRFVSHDTLAEALWPGHLPADPVANLQVLVNRARRALGDPALVITGQGGYTLAGPPHCAVDAEHFLAAVAVPAASLPSLREALALWQGEPLPEEAYDDWAADYREALLRARQHALERVASLALEQGDVEAAVEQASRAVAAEPLREAAVVLLIEALAASGDVAAALTAYDEHRRRLADELGVDPSPAAAELHQRLLGQPAQRAPATRRRRGQGFRQLPFVGREVELGLLQAALSADRPACTVVTVSGPSGSGKSRLLDALAREVPLVRARAYLPERSEPWSLVRTLVREIVAQDVAYVEGLPVPMAAALAWLLPELERHPGAAPDPESRRVLVHEAALRLLEASGLVVAVDDLQWCDPSSLSVLEAAVARVDGLRLVLALRPEEVAERADVTSFVARASTRAGVELAGLSDDALANLVEDPAVVDALREHTDGIPMAVEEVLRALAAEGLVVPAAGGRWQSTDDEAASRAVTLARAGQRLALVTRVAAQSDVDREVLGLLSLLAREARAETLAAASGSTEADVLDTLSRLFRRGLVRVGEEGWATSHDLVTEVVTAGLDVPARARLHASLAHALRSDGDPLLLAQHLRAAGDARGASAAYAEAAQRALDGFADAEADQLATVGLDIEPSTQVQARLREIRGQAREHLGDLQGARSDLRAALSAHGSGPSKARILARLAMLSSGADDLVRAAALAELAVVEAGDDGPTRARALEVASVLDMNLERSDRSAARASEALALYDRLGDANGMARILDARAMATFLGGDVRGGEAALRRAADLFEDSGDLVRVVTPRSTCGHALVFAGRAEEGLVQASAALDLARTLGHPEGQTYSLWHRAEALAALDRTGEAAAAAAEALDIATRIGHRGWTATAWRAVGLAAQQRGDLEVALDAYLHSAEASEHLGLFASWAAARAAMVLVLTRSLPEARSLAERALGEGPALGHYEARWAQVEVAAAYGDASAAGLAREALDLLDAGGVQQGRERLLAVVQA